MTRFKCVALLGLLLLGASPMLAADDDNEGGWSYDHGIRYDSDDGRFAVGISNMLQVRGISTDPELGSSGNTLDVARYKFRVDGEAYGHWDFGIEVNFAEGSETSEKLLEDAWVKYSRHHMAQIWVGQGKVQFGRQLIIDSDRLQFVDRSIATERFAHGRDVGVALVGDSRSDKYTYSVGVYNGNGINKDEDENQDYLVAARLAITPMGKFVEAESDPTFTDRKSRLAIGVSAMTNNAGTGSLEEERINTAGLEFAFRKAGFSFNAEFFTQNEDELLALPGDEIETDGWYAQAGYVFPIGELVRMEIAGRYSEILRDIVDNDTTETGAAIGFYFGGHQHKIQMDWRDLEFEGIPATGNTDTTEFRVQLQLTF